MKKRLLQALELIGDDLQGRKLIDQALAAAADYVRAVIAMESGLTTSILEGKELRDLTERLDRNRSLAHNSLIDTLNISARYLSRTYPECPPGGIYPEPSHLLDRNRRAIGDWAGKIVQEIFIGRR